MESLQSSWYGYDFHAGLLKCVEATVEPCRGPLYDGALLVDHKLLKVPVIFVNGESMFLSEANFQVLQFLASLYLAHLEDSLAAAPVKLASIAILAGDLEGDADQDLADLT